MYEDKTYEKLLQRKLAEVPDTLDKREGSLIYDALAPNALESAMMYAALDNILNESFADTASRTYLIKRCAERGIAPIPASYAKAVGEFNIDVPLGSRFYCDKFNWIVTEKISTGKFYLECETAGREPNFYIGRLFPVEYIDGLEDAELVSVVINGEDEEDTESLRKRYLGSFSDQSYGFNRGQYIEVTESQSGVGSCKVYRAPFGPGTVKLVITDSNYGVPSSELVAAVQNVIDPAAKSGEGIGLAPIDHKVTVAGAEGVPVNIETSLDFTAGWTLADCLPYIENTLDEYYHDLNALWSGEENIIVRVSQIEARLLALAGITDIYGTKINGSAGNVTLPPDAVAVRGSFANA